MTNTPTASRPLRILVDTNVFVASYDEYDSTHNRATALNERIPRDSALFVTTQIASETLTILSQKLGKETALFFMKKLHSELEVILIDQETFDKALDVFKKIRSKNVSFADCTSFVVFKKYRLDAVFTFDQHFKQHGITLLEEIL